MEAIPSREKHGTQLEQNQAADSDAEPWVIN